MACSRLRAGGIDWIDHGTVGLLTLFGAVASRLAFRSLLVQFVFKGFYEALDRFNDAYQGELDKLKQRITDLGARLHALKDVGTDLRVHRVFHECEATRTV